MAQELRFRLNGTLYDGIANPEDFGITVAEEPTLGFRFVSYNNDLQLIGDAYAYLNGLIEDSCGCELVNVGVDFKCAGQWQKLCNGYIILAECITDMDRCKITTKLYDDTFSTKINNNKNIPFSLRCEITKNLQPVTPPAYKTTVMFAPASGSYDTTNVIYSIRVEDAFKHLVACMSDNLVDCVTPPFASGDYEFLAVTNGRQIITSLQQIETVISFEQLFIALQRKLNISISTTLQANGRPLLTIDYANTIDAQTEASSIINASGVKRKTDTARLYSRVEFGNDNFYEQWQCNNGDNACTFAQTPFFGFREESFGLLGTCNKDVALELLVRDVIFDTNIIEDLWVWGNQSFNNNPFIIDCEEGLAGRIVAKQFDPYSVGQTVYNGNFNNLSVSNAWLDSVPNSIFQYIQGYNITDTGFIVKFDGSFPETTANEFEIIQSAFTSLAALKAHGVWYLEDFSDPNNLFSVDKYTVPYTGIYRFNVGLVADVFRDPAPPFNAIFGEFGRLVNVIVERYNSNEEFVQRQVYPFNSSASTSTAYYEVLDIVFVCEQGDYLIVNIQAKKQVGDDTLFLQRWLESAVISGETRESFFSGSGTPFQPGELKEYDPCDFRGYLYDFEYPLTMADIQAIVQRPSAPVRFSRTGTINAGIQGTINQLNINSVIKQQGQFTIRSNEKL
jgi:hypothetical protein